MFEPARPNDLSIADIAAPEGKVERFVSRNGCLLRWVTLNTGARETSEIIRVPGGVDAVVSAATADQEWLRSTHKPVSVSGAPPVTLVDLFSGFGGLTVGLEEAARAVGKQLQPLLAVDIDRSATDVYSANYPEAETLTESVLDVFDRPVGSALSPREVALQSRYGGVDILVGGPPCQGHSNLNNRTRYADEKNALYRTMVRAAEVLQPEHILIENVPGAVRDRESVVQRTAEELASMGYAVALEVMDVSRLGVPQTRKRLVLMASMRSALSPSDVTSRHEVPVRDFRWAAQDLQGIADPQSPNLLDVPAATGAKNRARIDYLFDNGLLDLPDVQRPPCHASGGHSYKSVYGRMAWDGPAQTVTTGFYNMSMGRYVHPTERRTLTAHEAARLQFVPDWYSFSSIGSRTTLARLIGNAVPSKLSYAIGLEWLR